MTATLSASASAREPLFFDGDAHISNISLANLGANLKDLGTRLAVTEVVLTPTKLPSVSRETVSDIFSAGMVVEHWEPAPDPVLSFTLRAPTKDALVWLLLGKHGTRSEDKEPLNAEEALAMVAKVPFHRRAAHQLYVNGLEARPSGRLVELEFYAATLQAVLVSSESEGLEVRVEMECRQDFSAHDAQPFLAYSGRMTFPEREETACIA
jgi:hypothetical protein